MPTMRQKNEIDVDADQFRFSARQFSNGALPRPSAISAQYFGDTPLYRHSRVFQPMPRRGEASRAVIPGLPRHAAQRGNGLAPGCFFPDDDCACHVTPLKSASRGGAWALPGACIDARSRASQGQAKSLMFNF